MLLLGAFLGIWIAEEVIDNHQDDHCDGLVYADTHAETDMLAHF
jgi:hypothetical protein